MFSERTAGCGLWCPWLAAYQSPREGVEFFHARRHPWNAPPSYAAVSHALTAVVHQAKSSNRCAASITPLVLTTTCATGSQVNRRRHLPSGASWPTCWSRAVTMSPPRNERSGPRTAKPEDRPKNAPASAADQPPAGASSAAIVRQRGRKRRAARRREAITCRVSLLIPDEQRSWWHYLARCRYAGVLTSAAAESWPA